MNRLPRLSLPARLPLIVFTAIGVVDVYITIFGYGIFVTPAANWNFTWETASIGVWYLTVFSLGLSILIPAGAAALAGRVFPALRSTRFVLYVQMALVIMIATQNAMLLSGGSDAATLRDRSGHLLYSANVANGMPFAVEIADPTGTCYDLPPRTVIAPGTVSAPLHCAQVKLALYRIAPRRQLFCLPRYDVEPYRGSSGGWCGLDNRLILSGDNHGVHFIVSR